MQLHVKRSQRQKAGAFSNALLYCLDAKLYLTPEETAALNHARIWDDVIYASDGARRANAQAIAEGQTGNYGKSIMASVRASMHLTITIRSLMAGQHIECKDMRELLAAEDTLMESCDGIKVFLDTAATFDGREAVFNFDGKKAPEALVVTAGTQPVAPVPAATPLISAPVVAPQTSDDVITMFASPGSGAAAAVQPPTAAQTLVEKWTQLPREIQIVIAALGLLVVVILLANR